ncbi:MAG: carboxypeptidase regulatory-like domain-containing protein [Gemmataceae bacterium]|nr:carboxypeptidase regulatory-like domain-containing protein [Gemmataceae bacterium]
MRFLTASLCSLVAIAAAVMPASAGWDNVFQPTLFERFRRPVVTKYAYLPPVVVAQSLPVVVAQSAPNDPCQKCQTSYIQRSYYQPVTTYETREVKELVTTQRTSYYYAPVTSYRYSSYYDPCTCNYTQVAVPTTAYELRAQSCPVQNWVSRCVQVPVQGYQKVDYWQPQTTCCTTTLGTPIIGSGPPPQMPPAAPIKDGPPEIRGTQGAAGPKTSPWEQYYPPIEKAPEIRSTPGTSFQPKLGFPIPVQNNQPATTPQPPVKLDRIAVGPDSRVEGQVTRSDSSPKPNAKLLFVNASSGQRQSINANTAGRFEIDLPTGSWHVYLHGADDLPIYHSRVDVSGAQFRQVNLVSRSN